MQLKQKNRTWILIILSVTVLLSGGFIYLKTVQRSLWEKSVTDILEVTAQGSHALETYMQKDMEMLGWLVTEITSKDPQDEEGLVQTIKLTGTTDSSYICINLDTGTLYTGLLNNGYQLKSKQLSLFSSLQGQGIREPFLDGRTGIWTLGYYRRFSWPDGTRGLIQKSQPLSEISERFSLSFYNDTGFSYVVNQEGNILLRSMHRNSNRTFQNLFDIINLQGNDQKQVTSFKSALKNGKRGVARFHYQEEEYIFCYIPLKNTESWYAVSIVPNRVIMEQADSIVQNSQVFLILLLGSAIIMAAFFIVYRNSTRQVLQAEDEARLAAENANIAKSRFLSNMSHDIRTPMNAVLGMTRLAMDHLDEPDRVREYLKNISLSGQLLVGLINDILDMSKIESGKMTLNIDNASLNTLLDGIVKIIQPTVEKKNLKFDIRLHGIEHETLCFDALRLNQILLNLLSNAVKFTPENGSVSMDITESPSVHEDRAHLNFRIADTGIGMSTEFQEHIFDSFTREQNDRVNKIEGSGLGMAISKMIVDMMEGSIRVDSTEGEGSVFTVDLDFLIPDEIELENFSLPGLHVLVADDDPATCISAGDFLNALGVSADIVRSGREAVSKTVSAHLQGDPYGLVLLDWKMPDLDGVAAAKEIRGRTGQEIPVIIISASDWSGIESQALAAGVTGFIQKPFFKSTLYYCIRHYVLHDMPAPRNSSDNIDLSGRHILLVDDNDINLQIAGELLSGLGAVIVTADNGISCVREFEKSPSGYFDLILMDIQMPVMNGYEATKKIRNMERPDAPSIPIFAMTADAFAEDIEAAKKAGMNSHLAKPLDIPVLMQEIQKYLDLQS